MLFTLHRKQILLSKGAVIVLYLTNLAYLGLRRLGLPQKYPPFCCLGQSFSAVLL